MALPPASTRSVVPFSERQAAGYGPISQRSPAARRASAADQHRLERLEARSGQRRADRRHPLGAVQARPGADDPWQGRPMRSLQRRCSNCSRSRASTSCSTIPQLASGQPGRPWKANSTRSATRCSMPKNRPRRCACSAASPRISRTPRTPGTVSPRASSLPATRPARARATSACCSCCRTTSTRSGAVAEAVVGAACASLLQAAGLANLFDRRAVPRAAPWLPARTRPSGRR